MVGATTEAIADALIGAEATNQARDWVNTPALDKAPLDLADAHR